MHKLVLLFERPPDVAEFERRWSEEFVPRAERMPGLRRVTVTRVIGGVMGAEPDLHLMHELYFDNRSALERAMASEQGQRAGETLMSIAGESVELCFAEHREDIPRPIDIDEG